MRALIYALGASTLLLTGCAIQSQAAALPTPHPVPTATFAPPRVLPVVTATYDPSIPTAPPLRSLSIPTASQGERQSASSTRLYVTAFQSYNVSVVDPSSGHSLHEIPITGDQPGMAVSPDGTRLYVVDGAQDGQVRVFDTRSWQVIHREPIVERALLLGGNPIALSGDGRWLVVMQYSYARREERFALFDTGRLQFAPNRNLDAAGCYENFAFNPLVGLLGGQRLYALCAGQVTAFDAETLTPLWRTVPPGRQSLELTLARDGTRLYGLYPQKGGGCPFDSLGGTQLQLMVWDANTEQLIQRVYLNDQVAVPQGTCGRGGRGYLDIAPNDASLYVAWEDRLWSLSSRDFRVLNELKLPAPVDGLAQSVDGRELYLLPSTAGDLVARQHGLWTVDVASFKLTRHADDWPSLVEPFMFAAPSPRATARAK